MPPEIAEPDWKLFRQLRKLALERFCERVLMEVQEVSSDAKRSFHERYLAVYKLLSKRDRELADAFDNPRRSQAIIQLMVINSLGLVRPEELARFAAATQQIVAPSAAGQS